jgi:hypothetical protein
MIGCSESLVTASATNLKVAEQTHNQALWLITGGVRTTPIDAMLWCTGNTSLQTVVEENPKLLYEKSIRLTNDHCWNTYEHKMRNLHMGFYKKTTDPKNELCIRNKPQTLTKPTGI